MTEVGRVEVDAQSIMPDYVLSTKTDEKGTTQCQMMMFLHFNVYVLRDACYKLLGEKSMIYKKLTVRSHQEWKGRHQRWLKHRRAELNGKKPNVSRRAVVAGQASRAASLEEMRRNALERVGE